MGIRVGAASGKSVHIACDDVFPDGLHEVAGSFGAGVKPTFSFGLTGHYISLQNELRADTGSHKTPSYRIVSAYFQRHLCFKSCPSNVFPALQLHLIFFPLDLSLQKFLQ